MLAGTLSHEGYSFCKVALVNVLLNFVLSGWFLLGKFVDTSPSLSYNESLCGFSNGCTKVGSTVV